MDYEDLSYNTRLKSSKASAKHYFMMLYKKAMRRGIKKDQSIIQSKQWISQQLNKSFDPKRMDELTVKDCEFVVDLIKPYVKRMK